MAVRGVAIDARKLAQEVPDAFRRNGLINFAASISFQIVLALVRSCCSCSSCSAS